MTNASAPSKKILFICGSLRKGSLNRQLGEMARRLMPSSVESHWLDYSDLPYMNQDIEFPTPDAVSRVRQEVLEADALWICSPEYNYGIPGVLKNCIDWLSRPLEKGGKDTAIRDKIVTYTCVGGGAIAKHAAADLAVTLPLICDHVILTMHEQVGYNRQELTTSVLDPSAADRAVLEAQVNLLLDHLNQQ